MRNAWKAHPRACGENGRGLIPSVPREGSSPRMRGKPEAASDGLELPRLIPAHAGKTTRQRRTRELARAHPRACGENESGFLRGSFEAGSSPRMRGKHLDCPAWAASEGLIPAHAGKTKAPGAIISKYPAHPRACGENRIERANNLHAEGSSPRMRGKRLRGREQACSGGLIPAHAGKTASVPIVDVYQRAHPRACGENQLLPLLKARKTGSSPRMRGKPCRGLRECRGDRLIPAHAGKTFDRSPMLSSKRAHPRACGENSGSHCFPNHILGSSPRMRGKLH